MNDASVSGYSFTMPSAAAVSVTPIFSQVRPGENIVQNGSYGTNVYWLLTEDGELVIYGEGAMDYSSYNSPWYSYRDSVKSISIEAGISTVCDQAFYDCEAVTQVALSDSVTAIGSYAFAYCSALESITIPQSVVSLSGSAFRYCSLLYCVFLEGKELSIGNNAFDANSASAHFFYYGTAEEWSSNVSVGSGNSSINADTLHYGKPVSLIVEGIPDDAAVGAHFSPTVSVTTEHGSTAVVRKHYTLDVADGTGEQTVSLSWHGLSWQKQVKFHADSFGSLQLTGNSSATVTLEVKKAGTAIVAFYEADGRFLGCDMHAVTEGSNSFGVSMPGKDLSGCSWKIMIVDGNYAPLCMVIGE